MENRMGKLLVRNLACVCVVAFGVAGAMLLLLSLFMLLGVMAGEWAVLHVLAMIGMSAGFMILMAVCMAVAESCGVVFWKSGKEDETWR